MRKTILYILVFILFCCSKNANIKVQENIVNSILTEEEITYKNKLNILKTIDSYIIEGNYAKAKEIIYNIDINNHIGGLYSLLKNDKMKTEDKIEILKYITENTISNPFILFYIKPDEYDIFIKEFSLNINDKTDEIGRTILHSAVRSQNTELVDYLLENGININSLDNNGHNALFYNFEFVPIYWNNPVIEDNDAVTFNWAYKYGRDYDFYGSPYFSRIIKTTDGRVIYIMEKLLENGININQKTNYGWTILHFSIFVTTENVYNTFLEYNADENIPTNYGRTPKDLIKYKK